MLKMQLFAKKISKNYCAIKNNAYLCSVIKQQNAPGRFPELKTKDYGKVHYQLQMRSQSRG